MKKISIEKCDTCGHQYWCQKECTTRFIEIENGYPKFKDRGRCIQCNHCVAVCPKGAILDDSEEPTQQNELLRMFAEKRSIRFYDKNKSIPENVLKCILAAAQTAPTDQNRSTVKLYLVKDKLPEIFLKSLEILKGTVEKAGTMHPWYHIIMDLYKNQGPVLWNAEYLVLAVGAPKRAVDAAITSERMQLMAHSLGVGTTYNGSLVMAINETTALRELIGIADHEKVHAAFAMGIPQVKYYRPIYRENKKVYYL